MIRSAADRDEGSIREYAEDAYRCFVEPIGGKPAPMVADFAAVIAGGRVYVLEDAHDRIAVFIVFYPRNGGMFLENVAVRTFHRGKGFGGRG